MGKELRVWKRQGGKERDEEHGNADEQREQEEKERAGEFAEAGRAVVWKTLTLLAWSRGRDQRGEADLCSPHESRQSRTNFIRVKLFDSPLQGTVGAYVLQLFFEILLLLSLLVSIPAESGTCGDAKSRFFQEAVVAGPPQATPPNHLREAHCG